MSRPNPFTLPVIISRIQHSNSGKIVVVEGKDDIIVYRVLNNLLKEKGITILPAGGRDKVLEVFNELQKIDCLDKAIFIVDQDSWIFTGIPTEYQHPRIICTSGYSIENDIYVDRNLENLMKGAGVYSSFNEKLLKYLEWFSLAITRFCTDNNACGEKLDIHPDNFFSNIPLFCRLKSGETHPNPIFNDLLTSYPLKFRGKCLMPLVIGELNNRSESPSYNSKTIMEETAINGRGECLNRIFSTVESLT